jgi:hypothetical protein
VKHAPALVLATTISATEIAPTPLSLRRVPAIVRSVGAMRTPLDLSVIPFRYRVIGGCIEAVRRPECRHHRHVIR